MSKRGRGNLSKKIDRQALHEYLWESRDRKNRVPFSQIELAEKLGLSLFTINKIFGEFREAGRLTRVGSKYEVVDPTIYAWKHTKDERTLF